MFNWFIKLFKIDIVPSIFEVFDPIQPYIDDFESNSEDDVNKPVRPNFEKMSKEDIIKFANDNHIKLDRRKKIETMIEQIQNHLNKEN